MGAPWGEFQVPGEGGDTLGMAFSLLPSSGVHPTFPLSLSACHFPLHPSAQEFWLQTLFTSPGPSLTHRPHLSQRPSGKAGPKPFLPLVPLIWLTGAPSILEPSRLSSPSLSSSLRLQ